LPEKKKGTFPSARFLVIRKGKKKKEERQGYRANVRTREKRALDWRLAERDGNEGGGEKRRRRRDGY